MATAKPPAAFLVNYFPGYIEIEDADHIKTPIRSVRCGLAAPSGSNPGGYFCLVGQEQRRLVTGHRGLRLLEDFSFQTTFQLLQTIFDRMGLYQAIEVWTDFSSSSPVCLQGPLAPNVRPGDALDGGAADDGWLEIEFRFVASSQPLALKSFEVTYRCLE